MEFNAGTRSEAGHGQVASLALSTEGSRRQHRHGCRQERQGSGQGPRGRATYNSSTEVARLQGHGQLARGGLHHAHGVQRSNQERGRPLARHDTDTNHRGGAVVSTATAVVRSVKGWDKARRAWQTATPALKWQGFQGHGQPARGGLHYTHGVQRSSQELGRLWASGVAGFLNTEGSRHQHRRSRRQERQGSG
jgi:hypothetical protein